MTLGAPSRVHSKIAMSWGTVELEPEIYEWLEGLSNEEFGQAAFHIDLLEAEGVHLAEPYTRQLEGKLRELRFYVGRDRRRITYYIAASRRIILLTVFRKTKAREVAEVARAARAMARCISEGHTVEEDS